MSSQPIIDQSTYESLKESLGEEFVGELLSTYNEETPRLLAMLQQSYTSHNIEEFTRAAHSIKSSSNSIGALQLGNLAKELEMMGRAGNMSDAAAKVEILALAYEEVRNALEGLTHA